MAIMGTMQIHKYQYLERISAEKGCTFKEHARAPPIRDPQVQGEDFWVQVKTTFDTIFEQKRQEVVLDL